MHILGVSSGGVTAISPSDISNPKFLIICHVLFQIDNPAPISEKALFDSYTSTSISWLEYLSRTKARVKPAIPPPLRIIKLAYGSLVAGRHGSYQIATLNFEVMDMRRFRVGSGSQIKGS